MRQILGPGCLDVPAGVVVKMWSMDTNGVVTGVVGDEELTIDALRVDRVLLADGWHEVYGQTFSVDPLTLTWGEDGGIVERVRFAADGFTFISFMGTGDQRVMHGPLSAILAVETA